MQNDHKYDGWVAGFLTRLQQELEATLKGRINIYSEENPHTRLSETYNVSQSLAEKKFIT